MSMAVSAIHTQISGVESRRREAAQHAPRPARVRMSVQTRGVGETRLLGRKALTFGVLMMEEPSFSFGVVLDQAQVPSNGMPLATATVLRWVQNSSGLYAGAEIGFAVFTPFVATTDASQPTANLRLKFSLTFEATSLRSTSGTQLAGTTSSSTGGNGTVYRGTTS